MKSGTPPPSRQVLLLKRPLAAQPWAWLDRGPYMTPRSPRREVEAHGPCSAEGARGLGEPQHLARGRAAGPRGGAGPEAGTYPEERASRAAHIPGGARPGGSTRGPAGALALPAVGERRLQS